MTKPCFDIKLGLALVNLLVAIALLVACNREPFPGLVNLAGDAAEPFGERDARATVALFVDTECPVSNRYAPTIRRLHETFGGKGVKFWLVYPDPDLEPESIRRHLDDYGHSIEVLRDRQHALVALGQARVTPQAAIFSSDKKLVYTGRLDNRFVDFNRQRPEATRHDVEEVLNAILDGTLTPSSSSDAPAVPSQPGIGCYIRDLT